LHVALDQVARTEGFRSWSHLSAAMAEDRPARTLLARFDPGDLVLLGARPGHGKTLLGLDLAVEAAMRGRHGYFFTLDDNEGDVLGRLRALGRDPTAIAGPFVLETSDDICADQVIATLGEAPGNAVAVIDYLQLLDQRRRNPGIDDQVRALLAFAGASGSTIVTISQIDRAFERRAKPSPTLSDVRLPNPLDLTLFTKACFLHEGEIRLETVA
jgi:replicative DNA helicase